MNKTKITYLVLGLLVGIVGTLYVTNSFQKLAIEPSTSSAKQPKQPKKPDFFSQFKDEASCRNAGGVWVKTVTTSGKVKDSCIAPFQ